MPGDAASDRLELALAHAKTSGSAIARKLGISSAAFAQLKHGRYRGIERWEQIALLLGVSAEWLMHGKAPFPEWAQPPAPDIQTQILDELRALNARMIRVEDCCRQVAESAAPYDKLEVRSPTKQPNHHG